MLKLKVTEMNRLTVEEFRNSEKLPVAVVLDNVRSLYNVGSVFRTCDAFRVCEVLLCGITACPPNQEIHKTALGAESSVRWQHFASTDDAVAYLRNEGYKLLAVEQCHDSIMLQDVGERLSAGSRYALILGNEVMGVQQSIVDQCDACVEIPQFGTKHSLNVSVTAGIVLWEMLKALHL